MADFVEFLVVIFGVSALIFGVMGLSILIEDGDTIYIKISLILILITCGCLMIPCEKFTRLVRIDSIDHNLDGSTVAYSTSSYYKGLIHCEITNPHILLMDDDMIKAKYNIDQTTYNAMASKVRISGCNLIVK